MKMNKTQKEKMNRIEKILKMEGLEHLLKKNDLNEALSFIKYEEELEKLQMELIKLQRDVQSNKRRVVILFEGRDAAGKGGAIRRFTHHLNPRAMRVVALPKPTKIEQQQWYFQRYIEHLPNPGEIVFFDRSWYNRAVVEPVMGFCSKSQYNLFMKQVNDFEKMLLDDGVEIIKFWFSVGKKEQNMRFEKRRINPLKQWKLSPVDESAQKLWDKYSEFKNLMFKKTHTKISPWIIVNGNDKFKARIESIRYVLHVLDYKEKGQKKLSLLPKKSIIRKYQKKLTFKTR